MVEKRSPFGTQNVLTFDFYVDLYTATLLLYYFLYFTLQVYPRTGTLWGLRPPHPSDANGRNCSIKCPLTLLATGVPPEGFISRLVIEPMQFDMGNILEDPGQMPM